MILKIIILELYSLLLLFEIYIDKEPVAYTDFLVRGGSKSKGGTPSGRFGGGGGAPTPHVGKFRKFALNFHVKI